VTTNDERRRRRSMNQPLHSAVVIDTVPETDVPHLRHTSGLFVYDEVFAHGRLLGRWWASDGVIRPEMHFRKANWLERVAPTLAAGAFVLGIEGETLRDWRWLGAEETPDPSGLRAEGRPVRHSVVRLRHERRALDVAVHTRVDGGPFMARWIDIMNIGDAATAITSVAPWSGMAWNHRAAEHTPPDAATPFEIGYNHSSRHCHEGDWWWEALEPGAKSFDGGRNGRAGWSRPAFVLRNRGNGETLWVELGWGGNWRWDVNTRADATTGTTSVRFAIGPDAADPVLRVVDAGETVRSPLVHIGLFHAPLDTCAQAAHEYVRSVIMPPPLAGREQLIQANHRGYIPDRESEAGIKGEIDIAARIGAEMFVVDAGWYGPTPNHWQNNAGDWHAGAWLPNGLEPVVAHARERGMLFGLWVEIESIGTASLLRREHPDWVLTRDGRDVGNGRALDLVNPDVVAWMEAEIVRIIQRYDLDMFRLDYNTDVHEGGNRVYQGFVESTMWRHYEALYGVFDRVRAQFPDILYENCAGGGGRLDWETMRRFQIVEFSDWMRAPRGVKILYGLTYNLPPEIGLRTFGTEVGEHMLDGDLDFQLRLAIMAHPIFRGISPTEEELSPVYLERIVHALDLYRSFIRPLMPHCRVFHHTGMLPLLAPTPWCVLEYAAAERDRAVVGLWRTAAVGDDTFVVFPQGIDRGGDYRVRFDNRAETITYRGSELAQGVRVTLPANQTSELLLIERAS
jgi:alpha-galactosidase